MGWIVRIAQGNRGVLILIRYTKEHGITGIQNGFPKDVKRGTLQ